MRSVVLDTNLLLLLIVGTLDRRLIAKHKRTQKFTPDDYDLLRRFLSRYPAIVVTPNVVTETSNLLRQTAEDTARRLLAVLARLLPKLDERFIASTDAAAVPGFLFLGITDAAILHSPPPDSLLLTDDLPLFLQASRLGRTAVNFTHLQFPDLRPS
jgi:hypothetical protein